MISKIIEASQHLLSLAYSDPSDVHQFTICGLDLHLSLQAEIGHISRFNSSKALCNWAGLTPRVRKSDAIVRHGKISKQGSSHLRSTMGPAAMVASRFSPRWYRVYERLAKRCGKRGARVAVARRLLTVIYYMLKRDRPYEKDYHRGA